MCLQGCQQGEAACCDMDRLQCLHGWRRHALQDSDMRCEAGGDRAHLCKQPGYLITWVVGCLLLSKQAAHRPVICL